MHDAAKEFANVKIKLYLCFLKCIIGYTIYVKKCIFHYTKYKLFRILHYAEIISITRTIIVVNTHGSGA